MSTILKNPPKSDDKNMSGDGDGIKNTPSIRHPVPSSRKFTPTTRKTKDMKSKLELALKDMKSPHKKQALRAKLRTECSSVDTPIRIPNRMCLKSAENSDKIRIYCSPREALLREKFQEGAARLVLRYLLLNSWRKSRSRCCDFSTMLALKEDKINQLHMQIDVLQNLRKSESSKREKMSHEYHEIQRDFDNIAQDNFTLKSYIERLENEKLNMINQLKELNEKTEIHQREILEKNNNLNSLSDKFQKEREKLRRISMEKKSSQEQNYKLENIINIQKENLENLKSSVDTLQKAKLELNSQLEISQECCKQHVEKIRVLTLENARNKSKVSACENEKAELIGEIHSLEKQLDSALTECSDLKDMNASLQMEIKNLTLKIEEDRKFLWNIMRKGMVSTYSALKYLGEKITPALQANFTY